MGAPAVFGNPTFVAADFTNWANTPIAVVAAVIEGVPGGVPEGVGCVVVAGCALEDVLGRTVAVITGAVPTETDGVGADAIGVPVGVPGAVGKPPGCVCKVCAGGSPLIAVIKRRAWGVRAWSNSVRTALFGKVRLLGTFNIPIGV